MTKICKVNGRSAILSDGKVLTPSFMTVRTRDNKGKDIIFDSEYFKNLGDSGIKVFFIHCNTLWLQPNAIEMFEKEAKMLFDAVPDARIITRIGLHPPIDWIIDHPDECLTYSDGEKPPFHLFTESYEADLPMMYSLASSVWREDAGRALSEVWRELMKHPYSDRIIGCFPSAGATSEWYTGMPFIDIDRKRCLDYSGAMKREFSLYLEETYGTDENLRLAWRNNNSTIENPPVPTYDEIYYGREVDFDVAIPKKKPLSNAPVRSMASLGANVGSFSDLDSCPHVFDYFRAVHNATARAQMHYAKIVKEITPDRIVGMCYGAMGCDSTMVSGRNGYVSKLLNCPYFDFMLNPSVYENRQQGGAPGQRVAEDSFSLHNKIYISQEDTRTHAENRYFKFKYHIYDELDSVNRMKREFGKNICCDNYSWWFDQLLGGRRYKFPEIYKLIEQQQSVAKEAYSINREKNTEVAFIFSEKSSQVVSMRTTYDTVEMLRNHELPYIGVSYSQYYLFDFLDGRVPPHKLYVFVNCFVMNNDERSRVKSLLRENKAVALWIYASGFVDPTADRKVSVDNISDLTDIKIEMENDLFDPVFRFSEEEHKISSSLDKRELFGHFARYHCASSHRPVYADFDSYLYPLFHSVDEDAVNIAFFATSGYPSVSVKECNGFTSIFYGAKLINRKVLRAIARFAGAHIYSESDDVIFVGKNYITFHSASSGEKTVNLPSPSNVFEVYEGEKYGESVTQFSFNSYIGETKMFRIDSTPSKQKEYL